jgi:hypothetical protein
MKYFEIYWDEVFYLAQKCGQDYGKNSSSWAGFKLAISGFLSGGPHTQRYEFEYSHPAMGFSHTTPFILFKIWRVSCLVYQRQRRRSQNMNFSSFEAIAIRQPESLCFFCLVWVAVKTRLYSTPRPTLVPHNFKLKIFLKMHDPYQNSQTSAIILKWL